jgi:hypothetical protein
MRYSVDGGVTYQDAPQGIRVLVDATTDLPFEPEAEVCLSLVLSREGLICDLFHKRDGDHIGTSCEDFDDVVHRLTPGA